MADSLPLGVLFVYVALVAWFVLGVRGLTGKGWRDFLNFGNALMVFLNIRYLLEGVPAGITFFIGIYDVFGNVGVSAEDKLDGMGGCPGNECSAWGGRFTQHPGWAVAFYDRFTNGPKFRTTLLIGHIVCNSIVFLLMHVQLFQPGGKTHVNHRMIGRISFLLLTIGLICATRLASQHGSVKQYGGSLSTWGFYSMAAFVYSTAIMGVVAIRSGNMARHRVWMWRFVGSMWGSFWLFRVGLLIIDPIFHDMAGVALLICTWGSAPGGILIAEIIRRRIDNSTRTAERKRIEETDRHFRHRALSGRNGA